jgi:hypothetical protein
LATIFITGDPSSVPKDPVVMFCHEPGRLPPPVTVTQMFPSSDPA